MTYLVIVESPFAGDIDTNLRYAREAMRDCFERGETPFASHLLYTQPGVLDDTLPEERLKGISAGYIFWAYARKIVFYTDLGFSPGMLAAYNRCAVMGWDYEQRSLPAWQNHSSQITPPDKESA